MTIFTVAFWRATGWGLLRTTLAGLVPFVPALVAHPSRALMPCLSTVGLLLVVAVLTSLRRTTDPSGPWWKLMIARGLRQFAQFTLAGIGSDVMLSDVGWQRLLIGALASAISTVLLTVLTFIPKSDPPAE